MLRPLSGPFGERGRDMQRRLLDSFGVAMALAAVVVVFRLAAVPAMGQTTGTTAWGHLDLGGIWLDVYDTHRASARSWAIESSRPLKRDLPAMRRARPTRRATAAVRAVAPQDVSGAYNAVYSSAKLAGPPAWKGSGQPMIARHPTADVLNPLLWLGCHESGKLTSMGSGVATNVNGGQYLVTALHVIDGCELNPRVRFNGQWNEIIWQTLAVDEANDIAVLKTETTLDAQKIPVLHGEPTGLIYGQIGYALGFPGFDGGQSGTDHITEVGGKPIPIVSLAVANFTSSGTATYSASYINAGFSGGAIVFPVGDDQWTIAGIITHFPTIRRSAYRDGRETGDCIMQHTGLVGYTPFRVVEELIMNADPTQK